MAYGYQRRRSRSRRLMRYSTGRRSSFSSRGRGRYRRRAGTSRGREVRLVIQAPRGILPRVVTTGQGVRYRRRRRF
nr:MAG: hypothetical protein [Microvirus sp.]